MSGSSELDFFSQLFSQAAWLPLTVLFFGGLYLFLMTMIFRRAAERRRKARMALGETAGFQPAPQLATPPPSRFNRFSEAAKLPEPDLDLLIGSSPAPEPAHVPAVFAAEPVPDALLTPPLAIRYEESIPMPEATTDQPITLPEDAVEVMRLWRDVGDGSLIIQLGDQYYRHSAAIGNPEQKRRFEAVVRTLSSMIGLPNAAPRKAMPAPSSPSSSTPVAEPPKRGLFGKAKPAEPEQPSGIANQIEEFLQARLLASPQFAARSIHVRPTLDHGLRIEVDGHFYDSVAEVIDPDVREFLATMMREWEARH